MQSVWSEIDTGSGTPLRVEVVQELAAELRLLAGWLGLDDVVVVPQGDLAPPVAVALVTS